MVMEAFIYDAVRTPRGRGKSDGSLHEITPIQLASQVLAGLRDRNGIEAADIDDVILGCVSPVAEQGGDIARAAVLTAGYPQTTAGVQVNRFCASALEAVNMAFAKVMVGEAEFAIGGGVESMSRVPMGSDGGAVAMDPAVAWHSYFAPQGIGADVIATKFGFSRDDCDAYAIESQKRARTAWDEGRFAKSILPVRDVIGEVVLDHDEHMRPDATMQSLGALKASFSALGEEMPGFDAIALLRYPELEKVNHVHHAGNSSGIVDGASGVLIGSKAMGEKYGLKPRARAVAMASIGSEPMIMLTGPEGVAQKLLKRAGMTKADIDLWELNEAFASVVLRYMQAMDLDHGQINVNGGAIAMGHPLGATGAMVLGTALDELERTGRGTALVNLCVGVGMGTGIIIERV
jgi:acetyl-CoA C-acetyltransferase